MRPSATSVWGLELLVYGACSFLGSLVPATMVACAVAATLDPLLPHLYMYSIYIHIHIYIYINIYIY
jgi:hypothetical protein